MKLDFKGAFGGTVECAGSRANEACSVFHRFYLSGPWASGTLS